MCAGLARLPRMNMEGEEHQEGLQLACILGGEGGGGLQRRSASLQESTNHERKGTESTLLYSEIYHQFPLFLPSCPPAFLPILPGNEGILVGPLLGITQMIICRPTQSTCHE